MATNGKGWLHGSATHPARVGRNMLAVPLGLPWASHANAVSATTRGGAYGVPYPGEFLVTTTGGLGYSVAAGRIAGPGTFAAAQGAYSGYNDAAVTGSFAARHATLTRVDLVCYRIRDTDEDATGSEDDGIAIVQGTAGSGVPSVPSSLGTLVILSEVTIPSSAVGTALTFTPRVPLLSAVGATIICTSTTRPTVLRTPTFIFETDTLRELMYDGTGWVILSEPPQTWTPVITQSATLSWTATDSYQAWYKRSRGEFWAQGAFSFTSAGTPTIAVGVGLPVTLMNVSAIGGTFIFYDNSGSIIYSGIVGPVTTSVVSLYPDGSNAFGLGTLPAVTVASTDVLRIDLHGRYA